MSAAAIYSTMTKSSTPSRPRRQRFAAKVRVGDAPGFAALLDLVETLPPAPRKRKTRTKSMSARQVAFREKYQAAYDARMEEIREDRERDERDAREEQAARDLARQLEERARAFEREAIARADAYRAEQDAYWARLEALNAEAV